MILPFDRKHRFRSRRMRVLRFSSDAVVVRYSHDLMAKKKAPVQSWEIARFSMVFVDFWSWLIMERGRAFWGFAFASPFLYPLYCCDKERATRPSWSSLGSGQ